MFSAGAKSMEKDNWNFIIFASNAPTNFETIPIPVIRKVCMFCKIIINLFKIFKIFALSTFLTNKCILDVNYSNL